MLITTQWDLIFGGCHKLEVNVRDRGLAVGASSHCNGTVSLAIDVIPTVRLMLKNFHISHSDEF